MLRGTWKDIARAAFRVKELRSESLKCTLRELASECSKLVLTKAKNPSILVKTKAEDISNMSLTSVCEEWKHRAPLLYSVMSTIACPPKKKSKSQEQKKVTSPTKSQNAKRERQDTIPPSVAVAGSILLKQRSRFVNSVQLLLMMIIKYTGFQVCKRHFMSKIS